MSLDSCARENRHGKRGSIPGQQRYPHGRGYSFALSVGDGQGDFVGRYYCYWKKGDYVCPYVGCVVGGRLNKAIKQL